MKHLTALLAVLLAAAISLCAQVPDYSVSIPPVQIMQTWYDYMIGSYHDLPLQEIPPQFGGGMVMTYHARRTSASQRKVYFSYLDAAGVLQPVVDPWLDVFRTMGYPAVAMDRTLGKPFYAWHDSFDADTAYEVSTFYENYPATNPGIYSPLQQVFDPPLVPPGHENDEFIWPSIKVGPSPVSGMRRVYILGRNYTNVNRPSENVLIAYADYNDALLTNLQPLAWSYTTIPVLDDWHNNTTPICRRMYGSFAVGNDGNIYYAGYHTTWDENLEEMVIEPDLDVFVCDNYGQGTWQHHCFSSHVPSYNPWNPFLMRYAFYYGAPPEPEIPIPDEEMYYYLCDSSHFNLVLDAEGRLHIPGIWTLRIGYPDLINRHTSTIKEAVFDPISATIGIREIFPIAGTSSDDMWWMPWDADGDHQADYWLPTQLQPRFTFHFPFCHWDNTLHDDAMFFYYNYVRLTEDDAGGMMACLWQDSYKARCYNLYPNDYPQYAACADAPELYLAVSYDRGVSWREPIVMSAVETPEFDGMTPMWFYPSDRFTEVATAGGGIDKRLYLMFLDDNIWGAMLPPMTGVDWGNIMYLALDLESASGLDDPIVPQSPPAVMKSNYPNPFRSSTTLVVDVYDPSRSSGAGIAIHNIKGQRVRFLPLDAPQLGVQTLVWDGNDEQGIPCASGIYLVSLRLGGKAVSSRKITLAR